MVHLAITLLLAQLGFAGDDIVGRGAVRQGFAYNGGPVKVLILDADQTVRISTTIYRAPRSPDQVLLLPGVPEKIAEYERSGYFVAIMSNQVNAVKDTGLSKIDETMKETVRQIQSTGAAKIHYYDFAVSPEEEKPGTTMVERLEAALRAKLGPGAKIDRAQSLMVGDAAYLKTELRPDGRFGFDTANFDRKFAENNGINYQEPQDFFGWKKQGVDRIENTADLDGYRKRVSGDCSGLFHGLISQP